MANFFHDNPDLQFYFDKGVDWDTLVRLTEADLQAPGSHESVEDAVEFYKVRRFPERRDVLERWLELVETRSRHLADEITTTGATFLARLDKSRQEATAEAS
jgi:hypothetical protein